MGVLGKSLTDVFNSNVTAPAFIAAGMALALPPPPPIGPPGAAGLAE